MGMAQLIGIWPSDRGGRVPVCCKEGTEFGSRANTLGGGRVGRVSSLIYNDDDNWEILPSA